jgi:isoquinoline 1-oxidoreductase subunit beta
MRVELPTKVNGTATYGIDVQVPGMLYGTVLRATNSINAVLTLPGS